MESEQCWRRLLRGANDVAGTPWATPRAAGRALTEGGMPAACGFLNNSQLKRRRAPRTRMGRSSGPARNQHTVFRQGCNRQEKQFLADAAHVGEIGHWGWRVDPAHQSPIVPHSMRPTSARLRPEMPDPWLGPGRTDLSTHAAPMFLVLGADQNRRSARVRTEGNSTSAPNRSAYNESIVGQAAEAIAGGVSGASMRSGTTTGATGGAAARIGMR